MTLFAQRNSSLHIKVGPRLYTCQAQPVHLYTCTPVHILYSCTHVQEYTYCTPVHLLCSPTYWVSYFILPHFQHHLKLARRLWTRHKRLIFSPKLGGFFERDNKIGARALSCGRQAQLVTLEWGWLSTDCRLARDRVNSCLLEEEPHSCT